MHIYIYLIYMHIYLYILEYIYTHDEKLQSMKPQHEASQPTHHI